MFNLEHLNLALIEQDKIFLDKIFSDLNINWNRIISDQHFLQLPRENCSIIISKYPFQNKSLPHSAINGSFQETLQKDFKQCFIIATDASKSQNLTSIAGISDLSQFAFRTHNINSNFTAEALAICQALDYLSVPEKHLLLLTDSLSVLTALQKFSYKSPSIIHKIVEKSQINQHITFLWIPGHSTILWNEKADLIAKSVTEISPCIEWIASEDIISSIKQISKRKTTDSYRQSKHYEILGEIPDIKNIAKWTRNRREDIICARISTKTLITPGLLHRFNLSNQPNCETCHSLNNLDHILLHCRKYSSVRRRLWSKLGLNSLSNCNFKQLTSKAFADKLSLHIFLQHLKFFDIY
ncbi:uncharacterized protein LOC129959340 [Argiope bruennichi]|uniref:uncharacterized protein LOC129959340 n=1 Tax=Argiope bruennichi TaxID=94029 RepID=UPI00249532CB|nr:uncharacterized protein LOC129959340 [Argiope bruennichi]